MLCAAFFPVQKYAAANEADMFRFIHFTAKDGFPDKFVYDITQDRDGFLWIGGNNGLYRYDGIKFKRFISPLDKPDHQIANILEKVYYDRYSNRLWLASISTVQWFDLNTYTFGSFNTESPLFNEIITQKVSCFCESDEENILIGTNKGYCYLYNSKSGKAEKFSLGKEGEHEFDNNGIRSIYSINNQKWIVGRKSIFLLDIKSGKSTEYLLIADTKNSSIIITSQPEEKQKKIWLACGFDGFCFFDLKTRKFSALKQVFVNSETSAKHAVNVKLIEPVSAGNLLIGDSGLGLYEYSKQKFTSFINNNGEYDFKSGNTATIFTDRQGNVWIGSYYSGLSLNPFQNRNIEKIEIKNQEGYYVEPFGLAHIPGSDDFLVSGNLLNGLAYYSNSKASFAFIEPADKNPGFSFAVITDEKGNIYTTIGSDIYKLSNDYKKLIPLNVFKNSRFAPRILYNIIAGSDGSLYAGSDTSGIFRFDPVKNTAEFLPAEITSSMGTRNPETLQLNPALVDSKGNLWCTNTRGVFKLEKNAKSLKQVALHKATNTGAIITKSGAINEISPGHFLISTISAGFFDYMPEKKGESLLNFTTSNTNMSNDFIINIIPAKNNTVWLLHLQGLSLFDLKKNQVISNYTAQNGLANDDGGYNMDMLPQGRLFIRYFGYINILNTNTFPVNNRTFKPIITSFHVMDQQLLTRPLFNDTAFRFSYRENLFRIEFSTLNFSNSSQNKFKYKLEGVDNDWIYTENSNSVNYSGLSPGKYRFILMAANNDGIWNERALTITIKISTPFWKSWWFVLILLLIGLAIFVLWNQMFIKNIRREQQLKSDFNKQIAEMELKALRAQMNPHFIFNSLNSIQKYILNNDQFSASQYLTKFSRLIRLILDHSLQNNVLLSSEIDMLRLYIEMESLRFDNKFEWEISIDNNMNTDLISIPSMLIQPYVENAIWHGLNLKKGKGKLMVNFGISDEWLSVIVDDNGIGRTRSEEIKKKQVLTRQSYGMKITEDRMQILKKLSDLDIFFQIEDKTDKDGNPLGTRVFIRIPIENSKNSNSHA